MAEVVITFIFRPDVNIKRIDDFINGVGKTYTREETVAMARQALAEQKKSNRSL
jgi:hypothetical protein